MRIETAIKKLTGVDIRLMEPPPRGPVVAKWLKGCRNGKPDHDLAIMSEFYRKQELQSVTIFEQQGPGDGDEFTILHGIRKDGQDIFAFLEECIDARRLDEIVSTLPKSAWQEAQLIIQ